jgi:PAS domain S-box-containing protein
LSRRDAQALVASIDHKFLQFLETVPDAMILSDHQGRILLANTTAEWMFGYSRDELMGEEVEILVPERFQTRHREDRAAYYADPGLRPMGVGRDVWVAARTASNFPLRSALVPWRLVETPWFGVLSATSAIVNAPSLKFVWPSRINVLF